MSARDEAKDAIRPVLEGIAEVGPGFYEHTIDDVLNAIPADVHARIAIDRGGLIETDRKVVVGRDYQNGRYHNYFAPLYRLAEP
jgi:hypothetical protein